MIKTVIIRISSNQAKGISHKIADKYITRLSNFIDRYNEIRYITNKINNICEFVKGSTSWTKLITVISLPSVSNENTCNYNDNDGRDKPDV